jgi:hypothetical protein
MRALERAAIQHCSRTVRTVDACDVSGMICTPWHAGTASLRVAFETTQKVGWSRFCDVEPCLTCARRPVAPESEMWLGLWGSMHERSASIHECRPACRPSAASACERSMQFLCGHRSQLRYGSLIINGISESSDKDELLVRGPPLTALKSAAPLSRRKRSRVGLACPVVLLPGLSEGMRMVGRQCSCKVGVDVPDNKLLHVSFRFSLRKLCTLACYM